MLCALKAIGLWLAMLFVGTNLVGLVVRGILWRPPAAGAPTERLTALLQPQSHRLRTLNWTMLALSICGLIGYFYLLWYFWNVMLAFVGAMLMGLRVPDLLAEIQLGRKPARDEMPRGGLFVACGLIAFVALPLTWWAVC